MTIDGKRAVTNSRSRWRRWAIGCLIALAVPIGFVAYIIYQIESPYVSPHSVSPDGAWRAWLQRPDGSMQPMFYDVKLKRNQWFGATSCNIGSIYNYFAERYTRLRWPAPGVLLIEYGLSNRDTGEIGKPYAVPREGDCTAVRLIVRRDRTLDAAATEVNRTNNEYAVPVPDDPPFL